VIPLDDRAAFWVWREQFAAALDPRFHTIEWVEVQLLNGVFTLMHTVDAAIIVEVLTYPTGAKEVHGLLASGDLTDILETLIPQALAWGKDQGCITGAIESRDGWARALRSHGWREYQVGLKKDLD
jgi:hypothetical protein